MSKNESRPTREDVIRELLRKIEPTLRELSAKWLRQERVTTDTRSVTS